MKKHTYLTPIFWLLVIFAGIAFGAGVYEARVEVPQWLTVENAVTVWNADIAKTADPGLKFWAFVTTGPLTLLTLIGLVAVWKTQGAVKKWWLITLGLLLIDRLLTFGYFIPTMAELMSGNVAPSEAARVAQDWANLNILRLSASGLAFLASLKLLTSWYSTKVSK